MLSTSRPRLLFLLLASICLSGPAAAADSDADKARRFEELEKQYPDSPGELKLAKAGWLTERGNSHGQQGDIDQAVDSLTEAIDIKQDYFPAYISLALAYRAGEQYDKALETIERAPTTMDFHGAELGGFEYDVYYVKLLVYNAIPDHDRGLASAREALEVLDDPAIRERRKRAEEAGVVSAGSGAKIIEVLQKYVKIREARDAS